MKAENAALLIVAGLGFLYVAWLTITGIVEWAATLWQRRKR
jgi:hypothetical protein